MTYAERDPWDDPIKPLPPGEAARPGNCRNCGEPWDQPGHSVDFQWRHCCDCCEHVRDAPGREPTPTERARFDQMEAAWRIGDDTSDFDAWWAMEAQP
jgi:hypothetical protein